VLFKLTQTGTYGVEHYFSGGADGGLPQRIYLHEWSQTIFGSTTYGGSCTGTNLPAQGCGVVYSYVPSTKAFHVLYTFTGGSDGYNPYLAGVLENGDIYGSTLSGGANGFGTLFKLTPNKTGGYSYVLLYTFIGGTDGAEPSTAKLLPDGTLIGGTEAGGTGGSGVLYQFRNGTFTTLYAFANGGYPYGTPVVGPSGNIFGTTGYGGISPCNTTGGALISSYGCGTVYVFNPAQY
jgi:uncharacterized repeat protein (TIGR03803 family)